MRNRSTAILAGFAALALAGTAALAAGNAVSFHEMTVRLPGGGLEHIRYTGNVAPEVIVDATPFGVFWPVPVGVAPASGFAAFDRLQAQMDRDMSNLLHEARAMESASFAERPGLDEAALKGLGPGSSSYSVVSFSSGGGFCTQSVRISTPANGGKPQVVSKRSGDCGAQSGGAATSGDTASKPDNAATPIKLEGPAPASNSRSASL
jgi:hypothetical protein